MPQRVTIIYKVLRTGREEGKEQSYILTSFQVRHSNLTFGYIFTQPLHHRLERDTSFPSRA